MKVNRDERRTKERKSYWKRLRRRNKSISGINRRSSTRRRCVCLGRMPEERRRDEERRSQAGRKGDG